MRRILFWLMAVTVGWTYVGFPLVVLARGRWLRKPFIAADACPPVSVVIAAHNEAPVIRRRIENLVGLDYPTDRMEIIVASDGSNDGTAAIASSVAPERVRVLDLARVGKAAALNEAVAGATGEILVFSDANSDFAPDAIRRLTRPFADPTVGGVAGDQRYRDDGGRSNGAGERQYWDIDRRLKRAESDAGNVISATGAIYAIRRDLFQPVPAGVTDDFITSTAVIAQGRRLVFAADAIAYEPVARDDRAEYGRKVRVMTRGLRGVMVRGALLDPRRSGFYAVQLATHKVLRRLVAFPLVGLALLAPTLWGSGSVYRLAALGQGVTYGLAALGLLLAREPIGRHKALALPAFFVTANVAAIQAVTNILRGHRIDRWDPNVARAGDAGSGTRTIPSDELARRLTALAPAANATPDISIVVPVNAQGDLSNVERVLADISGYAGTRSIELILVVNNYPPAEPPDAIDRLGAMGVRVVAVPNIRTHGEAPPFSARLPGIRAARARAVVTFDADCRIPDPTALIDWYVDAFAGGGRAAYTNVRYYDLREGWSIRARMAAHHGSRWVKRVLLRIPTIRGSNYAVDRDLFLGLYERGMLAEDMNVGPAMHKFSGPIPYSGDSRHVVLTSGRMFRGGWRKLSRYLLYRLRSNLRVIPVHEDAASRTGREHEPVRRYVDNEPVRLGDDDTP